MIQHNKTWRDVHGIAEPSKSVFTNLVEHIVWDKPRRYWTNWICILDFKYVVQSLNFFRFFLVFYNQPEYFGKHNHQKLIYNLSFQFQKMEIYWFAGLLSE